MIVIIEGVERTGKTTVSEYFQNKGFIYYKDRIHIKDFRSESIAQRLDAMYGFIKKLSEKNINVVIDRFHISEYIYGKYYRNEDYDTSHLAFFDDLLSELNVKLVLMTREIDQDFVDAHPIIKTVSDLKDMSDDFKYMVDKSFIKDKFEFDISVDHLEHIYDVVTRDEYKYDFYLASPFFNEKQIEREEKVKQILRTNGYRVYAPREHGIVGSMADEETVRQTFNSNIEAIKSSKKVIAITDEKDMGTIWEAGYAYGIGKEVVYIAVTLGENPFNIMLSESGIGVLKSFTSLISCAKLDDFEMREVVKHE